MVAVVLLYVVAGLLVLRVVTPIAIVVVLITQVASVVGSRSINEQE